MWHMATATTACSRTLLPGCWSAALGALLQFQDWACNADTSMDAHLATAGAHQQPQTRLCPQQPPQSGLTPDRDTQGPVPSSSWTVRGRKSQVQHTPHTLQVHRHTPSQLSLAPAPPPCLSSTPVQIPAPLTNPTGFTGCSLPTCSTHTLVPLAGHTRGSSPNTSIALLPARYPHPHPDPPTWGLPVNPHQTNHVQLAWARYTDSLPEACFTGWSRSSTEPLTDCSLNFLSQWQ